MFQATQGSDTSGWCISRSQLHRCLCDSFWQHWVIGHLPGFAGYSFTFLLNQTRAIRPSARPNSLQLAGAPMSQAEQLRCGRGEPSTREQCRFELQYPHEAECPPTTPRHFLTRVKTPWKAGCSAVAHGRPSRKSTSGSRTASSSPTIIGHWRASCDRQWQASVRVVHWSGDQRHGRLHQPVTCTFASRPPLYGSWHVYGQSSALGSGCSSSLRCRSHWPHLPFIAASARTATSVL